MPQSVLDRPKLAKLLGMLGSSFDGEALNAGRSADRLVREAGLSWFEVLAVTYSSLEEEPEEVDLSDYDAVQTLMGWLDELSAWEQGFVRSVDHWVRSRGHLTERQREVVDRILDREIAKAMRT